MKLIFLTGRGLLILIAIVVLVQALGIMGGAQNTELAEAETLHEQVVKLWDAGQYQEAIPLAEQALAIRERRLGIHAPHFTQSITMLAALYRATGDFNRAAILFKRLLDIREQEVGTAHPNYAQALNNLAWLYTLKGEYVSAENLYQRAISILERSATGVPNPLLPPVLDNYSELYKARRDLPRAVEMRRRSEDIREYYLSFDLLHGAERTKQQKLNIINGQTNRTVSLHAQSGSHDQGAASLALTTILRRKGRALDAMVDQIGALRQRATTEDQQLLDQLTAAQSNLAKLLVSSAPVDSQSIQQLLQQIAPAGSTVGKYLLAGAPPASLSNDEQRVTQIKRLTRAVDWLQATVGRRNAEFRAQTQAVTVDAVRAALPAESVLIEIFAARTFNAKATRTSDRFGPARYVVYLLRPDGGISFVDLGPVETIDRAADRFLSAISNPATTNAKETGRALDELVTRPIRKLLGNVGHVLISPDGKLNLVPFAAMVDENGKYLVEKFSITYLTSGRDLLRLRVPRQSKQVPLVIANPAFAEALIPAAESVTKRTGSREVSGPTAVSSRSGSMPATRWPELRGTAEEAGYIKERWPEARVLAGREATEAAVKQAVAPNVLHLATHGFFLADQRLDEASTGENPMLRSGLVLAGANTLQGGGPDDGVLTALEVAGLNLWGTQLVVLSACETGVGEVRNGEGVYGLRRALVLAGAESEVMTLWRVDDTATSEVMIEYYRRLKDGEGRTEALRQVQLDFLGRSTRQHPFFWASFILNGDWRRIAS